MIFWEAVIAGGVTVAVILATVFGIWLAAVVAFALLSWLSKTWEHKTNTRARRARMRVEKWGGPWR